MRACPACEKSCSECGCLLAEQTLGAVRKREAAELRAASLERALEAIAAGQKFVGAFEAVACGVHAARLKGWWDGDRNDGERLALMHSERSEALEALRTGNAPDEKLPELAGVEVELADGIIRIMDAAAARGWRVAPAILAKCEYNRSRPVRHGKRF